MNLVDKILKGARSLIPLTLASILAIGSLSCSNSLRVAPNNIPREKVEYQQQQYFNPSMQESPNILPSVWLEKNGNPIVDAPRPWAKEVLDNPAFIRKDSNIIYLYLKGHTRPWNNNKYSIGLLKSIDDGNTWEWETNGDPLPSWAGGEDWNSGGDEACPAPVKFEDTIYMFYYSRPDPTVTSIKGYNIGVATSTDWIHFTNDNANSPIFGDLVEGSWDELAIQHPSKPILKDGTWYIFYSGKSGAPDYKTGIGYGTTKEDEFPGGWIKKTINKPLFYTDTFAVPKVIQEGNVYWMLYSNGVAGPGGAGGPHSTAQVKYRTSTDLETWSMEKDFPGLDKTIFEADIFKTKSHGYILAGASTKWDSRDDIYEIGIWAGVRKMD
ncbi:MAG: hypothetical protein DRN49_02870 [Thaumarchaeota archaeon]|nr:MAG: hypothetical protein DRN49_02870 [Nitrososphaerota archaeon]